MALERKNNLWSQSNIVPLWVNIIGNANNYKKKWNICIAEWSLMTKMCNVSYKDLNGNNNIAIVIL